MPLPIALTLAALILAWLLTGLRGDEGDGNNWKE